NRAHVMGRSEGFERDFSRVLFDFYFGHLSAEDCQVLIALGGVGKLGFHGTTRLRHPVSQAYGWLTWDQHLLFFEDNLLSRPAIARCGQLPQYLAHGPHCPVGRLTSYVGDAAAAHTGIEDGVIGAPG